MLTLCCLLMIVLSATPGQPAVAAASKEPNWVDLLKKQWDLDMDRDLRNPVLEKAPAALFTKVDKDKPVIFAPVLALGVETPTHGGWYAAGPSAGDLPADVAKTKVETWSYTFKQPRSQVDSGEFTPPP